VHRQAPTLGKLLAVTKQYNLVPAGDALRQGR